VRAGLFNIRTETCTVSFVREKQMSRKQCVVKVID
jgi:hypothetical protein